MGKINEDVLNTHLRIHTDQAGILQAFLHQFDVNYGKVINSANTRIHCYLLSPDKDLRSTFGFSDEILLVYSQFHKLEPRTIQAIESVFNQQPFRSRANPLTFFLVTPDENGADWVQSYLVDHPQFRTPIVIPEKLARLKSEDQDYIKNRAITELFSRDVYDYQLPLDEDMYFFGREAASNNFVDSIRKSQNKGLFGLRKTGKTSLLFKIMRICHGTNVATCVYIDCKRPQLRKKGWEELLSHMTDQLLHELGRRRDSYRNFDTTDRFIEVLKSTGKEKRICFIFDEIEYISPIAKLDQHWKEDFVDLWQTLWSIQSEYRRCCFVVAGVNPYVTEVDLVNGVQNPMFGIVNGTMLTGLQRSDHHLMVNRIGRQMGLNFQESALDYLFARYGGHPLLTRMACSYFNQELTRKKTLRPVNVEAISLREGQTDRETELTYYCRHIVSELQEFYKDEYELLEMLAQGNVSDFFEFTSEPEWIKHLKGYGVLHVERGQRPLIRIPVLQKYVANEAARRFGRPEPRRVLEHAKRDGWLDHRKKGILREFRVLLKLISNAQAESPYNSAFLPEANRISEINVVTDWADFSSFINNINICLVETIESMKGKPYFFESLKNKYTQLFSALHRIKVYRNNADHLKLNKATEKAFQEFIKVDLLEAPLSNYTDQAFLLQQVVLDELFVAIQLEINKFT